MAKEKILDRSFIQFQSQLNQAATPNLQLPDVEIMLNISGDIREIETSGEEFSTGQQKGIVQSPVSFENGVLNFVGFCYPLELMFGEATVLDEVDGLAPDGSTLAYRRIYEPLDTLRPHFATVDYGNDDTRFQRAVDIFLATLGVSCSLEETAFTAEGVGQVPLESELDSLVAASVIVAVPQKTPDPLKGSLLGASSASGLDSASPYTDAFTFEVNVGGRWSPKYVMNEEQNANFNDVLRKRPDTRDGMITIEENADAWAFYTRALNNEFWYLRYRLRGQQIVAGTAEVQDIDLSDGDDPTGGTFDMTILGITLEGIAWNVTAAALQSLIRSIVRWGAKDVTVGKVGFVYTITFPAYRGNVPIIVIDDTNLTSGGTISVTVTATTPGVDPVTELIQIDCCVAAREFLSRTDAPAFAEGDDAMEIPFSLKKRSDLNGIRVKTVNRVADLTNPVETALP